jgi:hypothetical protein
MGLEAVSAPATAVGGSVADDVTRPCWTPLALSEVCLTAQR